MEIACIASVDHKEIDAESIDVKIKRRDPMVVSGSLRQVCIERMGIVGRPSEASLAAFLAQLERHDIDVVVNIVRFFLFSTVRSAKFYISCFRRLVRAARCIRMYWQASRFRFLFSSISWEMFLSC